MKVIDHNSSSKQKSKIILFNDKVSYINQGTTNFNQSYNAQSGKSLIPSSTINKVLLYFH
jgi:hypothetical protein